MKELRVATASKKKPVSKKSTSSAKKSSAKSAKGYKTLKVSKSTNSFWSINITKQTVYWSILVLFIIIMQLWILKVQLDVVQATTDLNTQLELSQ